MRAKKLHRVGEQVVSAKNPRESHYGERGQPTEIGRMFFENSEKMHKLRSDAARETKGHARHTFTSRAVRSERSLHGQQPYPLANPYATRLFTTICDASGYPRPKRRGPIEALRRYSLLRLFGLLSTA